MTFAQNYVMAGLLVAIMMVYSDVKLCPKDDYVWVVPVLSVLVWPLTIPAVLLGPKGPAQCLNKE